MGLKLPVGALSWLVFPLCGFCASKHISFSFVSIHFLVRDWDSRQREKPALLKMQDLCSCNDLCTFASSGFGDAVGCPSHLGRRYRVWWYLSASPCLSPEVVPHVVALPWQSHLPTHPLQYIFVLYHFIFL